MRSSEAREPSSAPAPAAPVVTSVSELIREYANEVNIAASSFFAWKGFNNIAAGDPEILRALNRNGLFWTIIDYSLHVTFFTAIGRIFDRDSRSLTVHRFITECRSQISQFSKAALEKRRMADAHGVRPDYLDDYLKGVYEPVEADFQLLEDAARKYADIYRRNYEPIRHKIIAHKDFATIGSRDALFANTNIGEFEGILEFLHSLERVLWTLHADGRLTNLTDHKLEVEGRYDKDLRDLLGKLAT